MFQHQVIRDARQKARLTQAELAEMVGCKQTSVCQYEAGKAKILSRDKVERMAEVLGLDLSGYTEPTQEEARTGELVLKCCANDLCIRNRPYRIGADIHFMPAMVARPSDEKTHCDSCREVLDDHCPDSECKTPLVQGAFCPKCGEPYVPRVHPLPNDVESWIRRRRGDARELLGLVGPSPVCSPELKEGQSR